MSISLYVRARKKNTSDKRITEEELDHHQEVSIIDIERIHHHEFVHVVLLDMFLDDSQKVVKTILNSNWNLHRLWDGVAEYYGGQK